LYLFSSSQRPSANTFLRRAQPTLTAMVSFYFFISGVLLLPPVVLALNDHQSQLRGPKRNLSPQNSRKEGKTWINNVSYKDHSDIDKLEKSTGRRERRLNSKSYSAERNIDCGKKGKKGDDVSADCGDPDETRVAEPDNEELVIVPLATLKGHIYEDINGNGSQEEGESNLSEVMIELRAVNGVLVQTLTSDTSGNYEARLPPGNITVGIDESTLPTDSVQTEGDNPTIISMPPGELVSTVDGFQRQCLLEGHIYEDENGNGVQDGSDRNLEDVRVSIIDSNGITLQTLETDEDGNYSTRLPQGDVTVRVDHSTLPFEKVKQTEGNDPVTVMLVPGGISRVIGGFKGLPRSNDDKDVTLNIPIGAEKELREIFGGN